MASSADAKDEGLVFHPMDQFIIDPILTGESLEWYSFTNQALWMLISLAAISFVFIYGSRKHQLVPGRLQSIAELMYFFIRDMIIDIAGQEGLRYFPYIFTLFILTVAAAEAAIGLAIIVVYYRNSGTIRVEEIDKLKG